MLCVRENSGSFPRFSLGTGKMRAFRGKVQTETPAQPSVRLAISLWTRRALGQAFALCEVCLRERCVHFAEVHNAVLRQCVVSGGPVAHSGRQARTAQQLRLLFVEGEGKWSISSSKMHRDRGTELPASATTSRGCRNVSVFKS